MDLNDVDRALPGDLDALVALEDRAFPEDRIARGAWRHLLTRAHGRVMVVRGGDADPPLLGAAVLLLRRGSGVGRLYSLATAPEARGRGVGRLLLEAVLEAARDAGCHRLRLEVRADNEPALGLYRSVGFRTVEGLPGYYAQGAPGLRMERTL